MNPLVHRLLCLHLLAICCLTTAAQSLTPVLVGDTAPTTPAQQRQHYVVLVSLDGFRYDYPVKYPTPHLAEIARRGLSTPAGMLPAYPSLTFPNHYTIATGLYPEHHGIVANSFYDAARDETYTYTRPESNGDGTWYGGTPLWVLAEQQGMRAACLFWPGSEAEIAGRRPTFYLRYNDGLDDDIRIAQVVEWLRLPAAERPHLITLYYSNADHAGHAHGPDSPEVEAAVRRLDDLMGKLDANLRATGLPVDLIILADHGMVTLDSHSVALGDFADLSAIHTQGTLLYARDEASAERVYQQFAAHPTDKFRVYRLARVPPALNFNANPREGDPVVIPSGPFVITATDAKLPEAQQVHGGHGFDVRSMPEMKAIFFADGPDVRANRKLDSFPNVDVYPFVAQILGLRPPATDGSLKPLASALTRTARKRRPPEQEAIQSQPSTTVDPPAVVPKQR